MTTPTTPTKRNFGMHPNLLRHVIERQAGTLAKAILEGVMNSIDAGATSVTVTVAERQVIITDDGKGFTDMAEVEQCFEVFGTPHREGDAVYGQFRLGRGQLFCYGVNVWESHTFRMRVDTRHAGLTYELLSDAPSHPGCTITIDLYKHLPPSELDRTIREFKEMVQYAPVPVILNGKQISTPPASEKWDHETPDAWIRIRSTGPVAIYNRGVLCERHPPGNLGTSAIVVSKTTLRLNMARNQIDSNCPVWRRIAAVLREHAGKEARRSNKRLTDAEKQLLARQFLDGEMSLEECRTAKILTDVRGRDATLSLVMSSSAPVAVAVRGDPVAEKAHMRKLAFVFAAETLERFGVASVEELMKALAAVLGRYDNTQWYCRQILRHKHTTRAELAQVITEQYEPVNDSTLNELERTCLAALRSAEGHIHAGITGSGLMDPGMRREIRVGSSAVAYGWTDGKRNIWIERGLLKRLTSGLPGATWLAGLIVHEYCHSEANAGSHLHDHEFYETYHNLLMHESGFVGLAAQVALQRLAKDLAAIDHKRNKAMLQALDHDTVLRQAAERARHLAEAEAASPPTPAPDLAAQSGMAAAEPTTPAPKPRRRNRKPNREQGT